MFQFLSIIFFSWISSIFVGFFKSSRFFVSPCTCAGELSVSRRLSLNVTQVETFRLTTTRLYLTSNKVLVCGNSIIRPLEWQKCDHSVQEGKHLASVSGLGTNVCRMIQSLKQYDNYRIHWAACTMHSY